MKKQMIVLYYGFQVKHPNWLPITVTFKKNKGIDSGYNVLVEMEGRKGGFEFFFNSELEPTAGDAKDYAVYAIESSRKI